MQRKEPEIYCICFNVEIFIVTHITTQRHSKMSPVATWLLGCKGLQCWRVLCDKAPSSVGTVTLFPLFFFFVSRLYF